MATLAKLERLAACIRASALAFEKYKFSVPSVIASVVIPADRYPTSFANALKAVGTSGI